MLRYFDSKKRTFSIVSLIAFMIQVFYPTQTYALTGGPSQTEYESFEPAGATEMVNLATGDFVYNIPLLDVDGYPINISYHGGVNMEQEASWVGLGWSLNAGAINRAMRGFPDDFNGGLDQVEENIHVLPNTTYGLGVGGGVEIVGFDILSLGLNAGLGIQYNTYKGLGFEMDFGVTGGVTAGNMAGGSLNGGLGLRVSNQDGADFSMSGGLSVHASAQYQGSGAAGSLGVNRTQNRSSRRGLVSDVISGSASGSGSVYGATFGTTTGSAINLIPNTAYTPNMQYPTTFSGITGEIHAGGEVYWCNFYGYLKAFKFEEKINGSNFKRQAYGYLNLENSGANAGAMLDFNRDLDGTYYLECPKLPFANLTYDLFNANAQGLNELYRPYRNDLGYVFDPIITGGGSANDIGIELNYGNLVEIGFNDYGITTNSFSGPWYINNNAKNNGVYFKGDNQLKNTTSSFNTYEHSYFKALDELNIEDPGFSNALLGSDLASFRLNKISGSVNSTLEADIVSSSSTSTYSGQKKDTRQPRNNNFNFLNVTDASIVGLNKTIKNYALNIFNYTPDGDIDNSSSAYSTINRNSSLTGRENHISEVTVTKEDGARYVYGIPMYNNKQKEVMFSSQGLSVGGDQLVNYAAGSDNSTGNTRGREQFYVGRELPSYSHGYLLTGLLSKDYVDITGDGPSNDDHGDYTKFNYTRTSTDYKWRNPFNANTALEEPGWRSDQKDDKGVYVYGEKELWYLHSIETKNYVAEFHTSARSDAQPVASENGGLPASANTSVQKLEKIVLYSKKDLTTPIKTVNFKYTYDLCPNTPNSLASNKGKLTLDKIYFTYGNSDKGVFSPYTFFYCDFNQDGLIDPGLNEMYNRTNMDRWGNFQLPYQGSLDNRDFPYTQQNKSIADKNTRMWSLSSIITPAKSRINLYYESDDYSFIQNQGPAQMITTIGFTQFKPTITIDPKTNYNQGNLYSNSSPYTPNNYVIVDLTSMKDGGLVATTLNDAENILRNKMLPASGKLFFKGNVQISGDPATMEFVPGYCEFDPSNSGVFAFGSFTPPGGTAIWKYAYIKLKDVDIEDMKNYPGDNCNPISKASWQIARNYLPHIAYPGSEPGGSGLAAMAGLLSAMTEVFTFKQKNGRLRKKLFGKVINPNKSFVRLNIPNKTKFGGGHRISKIEIVDNWNSMVSSETTTTYGQTYNYTINEDNQTISSGVSSYEPLAGGDEISLRSPYEYSVARIEAPDDAHFFEYPIGEAFFPAPTVVYSKVTVRNIERRTGTSSSSPLITGNIGRTEYEFYTARDFPISSGMNGLDYEIHTPKPGGNLFSSYLESSVHLSQGSILKLNNMHGKLKSILTFQEGNNNPISGVKYYYKKSGSELDNNIPVIDEKGNITTKVIGQHIEAVADFRQQNTITFGTSITGNLNVSIINVPWPLPIPIPSIFWGTSTETRDFYSATLNKVVTQNGILERVETISNYATSITENLVWDANTSNVVLSRTSTNFRDYDYDYTTPAHWVYQGMNGAYRNVGYGFKNAVVKSTGQFVPLSAGTSSLIVPGDEVELIFTSSDVPTGIYPDKLWVSKNSSGNLILIDRDGKLCTTTGGPNNNNVFGSSGDFVLKVIRSGYKNILDESAEMISYSKDPRTISGTIDMNNNILDANAQEFSEDWQKYCHVPDDGCSTGADLVTCFSALPTIFDNTNPYIMNTKGNWNSKRNYSYLGKRLSKDLLSGSMDIRKDGTFDTYKPFFKYGTTAWDEVYKSTRSDYSSVSPFSNWVLNSEVTKINSYGNVLEAKDAINRYSASIYAYNHTLKTASAVNSKQRDIGFDSFEDYNYGLPCMENHFGFRKYKSVTVYGIAHTGRYSLKVAGNDCASTTRLISDPDCETNYGSNNQVGAPPLPSITLPCECASGWSPVANKATDQKYVLSVWVKEVQLNKNGDYVNPNVEVYRVGIPTNLASLIGKSPIINGWQKLDYEFTIPAGTPGGYMNIRLGNNGSSDVYFDDIRVQPFNATMATYVYDPLSLRIWAELDERNFATIYEYDNEGVLVRMKKETERGIQTIKETRNSFKKL